MSNNKRKQKVLYICSESDTIGLLQDELDTNVVELEHGRDAMNLINIIRQGGGRFLNYSWSIR